MAHLRKSDATGHLLKSGDGHLVNDCGAQDCPGECSDCWYMFKVVVSGFTGACADLNGTYYPAKDDLGGADDETSCTWGWAGNQGGTWASAQLLCTSQAWRLQVYDDTTSVNAEDTKPNTDNCPPTGDWTLTGGGTCAGQSGTATVTQEQQDP